jgi:hypothetical protein
MNGKSRRIWIRNAITDLIIPRRFLAAAILFTAILDGAQLLFMNVEAVHVCYCDGDARQEQDWDHHHPQGMRHHDSLLTFESVFYW